MPTTIAKRERENYKVEGDMSQSGPIRTTYYNEDGEQIDMQLDPITLLNAKKKQALKEMEPYHKAIGFKWKAEYQIRVAQDAIYKANQAVDEFYSYLQTADAWVRDQVAEDLGTNLPRKKEIIDAKEQ